MAGGGYCLHSSEEEVGRWGAGGGLSQSSLFSPPSFQMPRGPLTPASEIIAIIWMLLLELVSNDKLC